MKSNSQRSVFTLVLEIDGFKASAKAVFNDASNEWDCICGPSLSARPEETRSVGYNLADELLDMIDLELDRQRKEHAFNQGPFSTAMIDRMGR